MHVLCINNLNSTKFKVENIPFDIEEYLHPVEDLLSILLVVIFKNIAFAKGGPHFPITHALCLIATTLQAHMPAIRTEMTIWGVKGGPGPLILFWLNLIFFDT